MQAAQQTKCERLKKAVNSGEPRQKRPPGVFRKWNECGAEQKRASLRG